MALKLSPPWIEFATEVKAMFYKDPEVKVVFDEDNLTIKLYVNNTEKAEALSQILPPEKEFGCTIVKIVVIPANVGTSNYVDLFHKAFKGNPIFVDAQAVEGVFSNPITYVTFKKDVVQFWNDDLGDINGLCSTLYKDLAKDIFEMKGVTYSTEKGNDIVPPLK